MAFDEKLAQRTREILKGKRGIEEKKMFGGLCFTLNGNMCCGVLGSEIMVRVGPDAYEQCLQEKHAREMDFTGKALKGMVYVSADGIKRKDQLSRWLAHGTDFAASLPKKKSKTKKKK